LQASAFIPTDWYPTVVVATAKDLLIGSAKGRGSGPNPSPIKNDEAGRPDYPYTPALINGSLARLALADLPGNFAAYSRQVSETNAARGNGDRVPFAAGENKIRHVIYIIKENRTYDQVFGDIAGANGDPSLTMYGEDITPNQHRLARQFGVLDNFYDSGDVSGDGHVWSTSASISDYIAKTWPIGYRGHEHTYDSEGTLLSGIAVEDHVPDAGEPTGGYLWKNFAAHDVSYRHYGEYIVSRWCNAKKGKNLPTSGPPKAAGTACARTVINKGELLEKNVGDPRGGPSPYPWPIPVLAKNIAAEVELRGHFDPLFPDFEVSYPDQLRADEFLNEFSQFVASRNTGKDTMPQFILLRLPMTTSPASPKTSPRRPRRLPTMISPLVASSMPSRTPRIGTTPHSSSSKMTPRTVPFTSTPIAAPPWSSANTLHCRCLQNHNPTPRHPPIPRLRCLSSIILFTRQSTWSGASRRC
jgi:hypothetical protein